MLVFGVVSLHVSTILGVSQGHAFNGLSDVSRFYFPKASPRLPNKILLVCLLRIAGHEDPREAKQVEKVQEIKTGKMEMSVVSTGSSPRQADLRFGGTG